MFWSAAAQQESKAISALAADIFFIAVNDNIYGWTITGKTGVLKCTIPIKTICEEEGDELVSMTGNEKYIGFVTKYGVS